MFTLSLYCYSDHENVENVNVLHYLFARDAGKNFSTKKVTAMKRSCYANKIVINSKYLNIDQ